MKRTTVYSLPFTARVNLNDSVGLDPFVSYTVADHLENLEGDGRYLVSREGPVYSFSDGSVLVLIERSEDVDESALDPVTAEMVRRHDADAGENIAAA